MQNLSLDLNEAAALASALDNYINGIGMLPVDEDEDTLESILGRLS